MRKLLEGIVKFRREVLPSYRDTFARLALGQSPDALYIGCSDSRVAVNVFASTDPGDLFVVRNVGNFVPTCNCHRSANPGDSVSAAIEFALCSLQVSNIIVCGHSECGAMQALVSGRDQVSSDNLREWLQHGDDALAELLSLPPDPAWQHAPHNQLSQINVMKQLEHLRTYPIVQERLKAGKLALHGWWFDLKQADVYAYEKSLSRFVLIDEEEALSILS